MNLIFIYKYSFFLNMMMMMMVMIMIAIGTLFKNLTNSRDRGATLRLGGGGTISDSILGGTKHFFLLILYSFKNIAGRGGKHVPPPPRTPYSAVPE